MCKTIVPAHKKKQQCNIPPTIFTSKSKGGLKKP